ncbi:4-hydroxy-tetrahydrodipicolinate reductase [Eubacteriales bacterium OttesenSCG-928-N13]|nr:4-hydroxy-tetrahydrodipicolinate reductase [Eubacteriales bacterium OttesenSCG-928-N13]
MNIILVGYGRMGKLIAESIAASDSMRLVGIVDPEHHRTFDEIDERADVVIDFSYPGNLTLTLDYVMSTHCALVLGTTGLNEVQLDQVKEASSACPIVFSYNFSTGIAVLKRALALVAPALKGDFDIEIVEAHHRAKADAPSGTAKLLRQAIDPDEQLQTVDGRSGITGARPSDQIGMHAIRGGSVAGDHSVLFLGDQEMLKFEHSASSRQIFVNGALRAVRFVHGRAPGLYGMDDILWGDQA